MPIVVATTAPPRDGSSSRLRAAREQAGLGLREFARLTLSNHPRVSRVERGLEAPSAPFRRRAADVLGIEESWLFEDAR